MSSQNNVSTKYYQQTHDEVVDDFFKTHIKQEKPIEGEVAKVANVHDESVALYHIPMLIPKTEHANVAETVGTSFNAQQQNDEVINEAALLAKNNDRCESAPKKLKPGNSKDNEHVELVRSLAANATAEEIDAFYQEYVSNLKQEKPIDNEPAVLEKSVSANATLEEINDAHSNVVSTTAQTEDQLEVNNFPNINLSAAPKKVRLENSKDNEHVELVRSLAANATAEEIDAFYQEYVSNLKHEKPIENEPAVLAKSVSTTDTLEEINDAHSNVVSTTAQTDDQLEVNNFRTINLSSLHLNQSSLANNQSVKRTLSNKEDAVSKRFCVRTEDNIDNAPAQTYSNFDDVIDFHATGAANATANDAKSIRLNGLQRSTAFLEAWNNLQLGDTFLLNEFTYLPTARRLPKNNAKCIISTDEEANRFTRQRMNNLNFPFNSYSSHCDVSACELELLPSELAQIACLLHCDVNTIDKRLKTMNLPKRLQKRKTTANQKYLCSANVYAQTLERTHPETIKLHWENSRSVTTQTDPDLVNNSLSSRLRGLQLIKLLNNFNEPQMNALRDFSFLLFNQNKGKNIENNILKIVRSAQAKTIAANQRREFLQRQQQQHQQLPAQSLLDGSSSRLYISSRDPRCSKKPPMDQPKGPSTSRFNHSTEQRLPPLLSLNVRPPLHMQFPATAAAENSWPQQSHMPQTISSQYMLPPQPYGAAPAYAFHQQQQQQFTSFNQFPQPTSNASFRQNQQFQQHPAYNHQINFQNMQK